MLSGGRKSDLNGVAFHDVIVNIVVLLAKRWVRNSNVFGITGKGPLWSFDAHANSVAVCERATNVQYWIPRFGSKRYLIPVFCDRSAFIGILCASDERGHQQAGQEKEKDKATHASKYSTAVSPVTLRLYTLLSSPAVILPPQFSSPQSLTSQPRAIHPAILVFTNRPSCERLAT